MDLDQDGYAVVARAIDSAHVDRLRRAFQDAPAQADGTQHVPLFDEALATHPAIASAARVVFEGAEWRVRAHREIAGPANALLRLKREAVGDRRPCRVRRRNRLVSDRSR